MAVRGGEENEMVSDALELRRLMRRVERLEKRNRWLRRAGIAMLAAFGTVLLMGLNPRRRGLTAQDVDEKTHV